MIRHGLVSKLDGALRPRNMDPTIDPQTGKRKHNKCVHFFWVAGKVQTDNVLLCSSEIVIFAQVVSAAYSFRKKNLSWFEFLTWFHFAIIAGGM